MGNRYAINRILINQILFYYEDINSIIFNGVKLTHFIVNLERSLAFSIVSTHTDYIWGHSSFSAEAELVS